MRALSAGHVTSSLPCGRPAARIMPNTSLISFGQQSRLQQQKLQQQQPQRPSRNEEGIKDKVCFAFVNRAVDEALSHRARGLYCIKCILARRYRILLTFGKVM